MQFFGKYDTNFGSEFLTESYLYFNENDEEITPDEFEELIKNKKLKKKNIAGTIFMYNPFYYPIGYDEKKMLSQQDFEFDNNFHSLKVEREITIFKQKIKSYPGQIIEIKNLFNLNIANINTAERLVNLNMDVEKLPTAQLTIFDRKLNYQDINDLTINGKFVFFAWGNKINKKEFVYIYDYAKSIYEKVIQMQKKVAYIYRKSIQEEMAIDYLHFLHPTEAGKLKNKIPACIEEVFDSIPPQKVSLDDM